jgi:hypothetical protein
MMPCDVLLFNCFVGVCDGFILAMFIETKSHPNETAIQRRIGSLEIVQIFSR